MGDASTSRPRLRALPLPLLLAAGCVASRGGAGAAAAVAAESSPPGLVFAYAHELKGELSTSPVASLDAAGSALIASTPASTPWITGLYGLGVPEPAAPHSAMQPWSDDPWMEIEPPLYTRHITAFYGERTVTDDNAEDLDIDKERVYGLDFDSFAAPSGHGWECGVNFASSDGSYMGVDGRSRTTELYLGYRRTFLTQVHGVQPYISLGVTRMHAKMELGPMNSDDSAWGLYGRIGINWELTDRLRVGLDYRRIVGTEIDAFGLGIDSDHDQLAACVGWGF